MAKLRIYYLAPVRKTIFFRFTQVLIIQRLYFACFKQKAASTYSHCKPSKGHEILWTVGICISGLLVAKRMRTVF